ncbi:hypothetical protein HHI36_016839 [Cryptolaemus montrouzieri]|uniref:Uncharacterized protein n=1 Tax=Cryptolaemus montrouzieri TaxID=559131 RepID=A0ABD2NLN7_9CUCU
MFGGWNGLMNAGKNKGNVEKKIPEMWMEESIGREEVRVRPKKQVVQDRERDDNQTEQPETSNGLREIRVVDKCCSGEVSRNSKNLREKLSKIQGQVIPKKTTK